jgi:hypothetical protein
MNVPIEELLIAIKDNNDGAICVFDTEATTFRKVIFDFAYGFLQIGSGAQHNFKSYLNLDAIVDKQLLLSISGWKKIKDAAEKSYYGFFNTLKSHDWFSDDFSEEEIEQRMDMIYRDTLRKKVNTILSLKEQLNNSISYWETHSNYKRAEEFKSKRTQELLKAQQTEQLYINLLQKEENLTSDLPEETRMVLNDKALRQLYYSQVGQNGEIQVDKNALKMEVRNILNNPQVQDWAWISQQFMSDLESNNTCYVTSYNLNADTLFIKNTNQAYGCNIINMAAIVSFCSFRLYQNLRKNPENLLNLLGENAPETVRQAVTMTGKGSATLDMFTTVLGTNPNIQGERHTALYDTQLLADALANFLQKELKQK